MEDGFEKEEEQQPGSFGFFLWPLFLDAMLLHRVVLHFSLPPFSSSTLGGALQLEAELVAIGQTCGEWGR